MLVSGTVTEYVTGGTNYVSSQLYSSATQQASPRTLGYMPDGHRLSLSQSYVFPVAAAGQYTFQLRFKAGGNGLTVTAQEGVITALYVPFGPTGNTP